MPDVDGHERCGLTWDALGPGTVGPGCNDEDDADDFGDDALVVARMVLLELPHTTTRSHTEKLTHTIHTAPMPKTRA